MVTFIAIEALIVYNIKQKIMTKLSKMAMLLMFFAITATTPMFISCSSGDDNEEENYSPDGNNSNSSKKLSGFVDGHEAADLGLSVKWATCNVGTTKSEYFGGYYGWGDPTGKKTSSNSSLYPNSNPPTDIKNTKYDIAYNNWGKKWRMPTEKEMRELISKCYYTHKIVNGVNGLQFKGLNGGIIFLPFCGYRFTTTVEQSDWGSYWTSTLVDEINSKCLKITTDGDSYANISESLRCNGLSVRAVTDYDWDEDNGKGNDNTSGGSTGGSTSYEKPDIAFNDFTAYQTKLKVVYKIYNKDKAKVTSAKVYYGTSSNPTKSVTATVAGVLITANISGLTKGTTYYVKCVATGKGGTTTTGTTKVITNY